MATDDLIENVRVIDQTATDSLTKNARVTETIEEEMADHLTEITEISRLAVLILGL